MSAATNKQYGLPSTVLEPALLSMLPFAVLAFGGVHIYSRMALSFFGLAVGLSLILRSRYAQGARIGWALLALLVVTALPLVPVNESVRAALLGELAQPVQAALNLTGGALRPLGLDPWGGLLSWAEAVSAVAVGVGVAGWSTRAGRSRRLLWMAALTGMGVVAIMAGHQVLALDSIYGSGIGAGNREGFFAPFVNPNHGGILLAALAPLALTRAVDGRPAEQAVGALVTGLLCFGVWASGSRGAVVAAMAGLATTAAAAGGPRVRWAVAIGSLGACCTAALLGPKRALALLSQWVSPSMSSMVDAGYVSLTTGRLELARAAGRMLGEAPILGVGPAGFDAGFRALRTDSAFNTATHAHNEFLQFAAEHGVLALALGVFALVAVLRTGVGALSVWQSRPDRRWLISGWLGTVAALSVACTVDFPLRLHSHALLASIALGSLVGLARPHRGGRRLSRTGRRVVVLGCMAGLLALAAVGHGGASHWSSAERSQADGEAWVKVSLEDPAQSETALAAAAQHFERAMIRGLNRKSYQWLARVRALQQRPDEADQVLAAGVMMDPTMPWLWRDRARLAQRTGDADLARAAWASMLALDLPSTFDPMDVMHEAFFGGEFLPPIEQARAILPERADRNRQAARVMDQLGLIEESETLFRRALSMDPKGINHYAEALMRWGRAHDAVMLLQPNLKGCNAHTNYANGLLTLGRHSDAAEAYQAAISECGARSWALRRGLCHSRLLAGDSRGEDVVETLLKERPEAHGLRRAWLWVLSRRGRTVAGAEHLQWLKDLGVIRADEREALVRASAGLPFSIPEPRTVTRISKRGTLETGTQTGVSP